MLHRARFLTGTLFAVWLLGGQSLLADEIVPAIPAASSPEQAVPSAAAIPDTEILARTPVVDGTLAEGEWDTFYVLASDGWNATAYADWDFSNLYIAAKSDKPVDLTVALDARADGWFHGDDNFEIVVVWGKEGAPEVKASRYDSRSSKTPDPSKLSDTETALISAKTGSAGGVYCVELQIPVSFARELKLRPRARLGLNVMLKVSNQESNWMPTGRVGDVNECTLVTKKFATLKPLELGFDLRSMSVARGDTLTGKFHLTNSGGEPLDVRSFVIGGEGRAGEYLSSQRVRIEGLAPKQHVSHPIGTLIPSDMPKGFWAMGAEVRSGNGKIGAALVSFEVVDPFDAVLRLPNSPIKAGTKEVTILVNLKNNSRKVLWGSAKITLPAGWEIWRNRHTQQFGVAAAGGETSVRFIARPPLGQLGDVPVQVAVTAGKESKILEGTLSIVNP